MRAGCWRDGASDSTSSPTNSIQFGAVDNSQGHDSSAKRAIPCAVPVSPDEIRLAFTGPASAFHFRHQIMLAYARMSSIGAVPIAWSCAISSNRKRRSEEHTSELQSLMRISYAVFCLKKQTKSH